MGYYISKSRGNALLLALLAVSLVSLMVPSMMSYVRLAQMRTQKSSVDADVRNFMANIRNSLVNPESCRRLLAGEPFNIASTHPVPTNEAFPEVQLNETFPDFSGGESNPGAGFVLPGGAEIVRMRLMDVAQSASWIKEYDFTEGGTADERNLVPARLEIVFDVTDASTPDQSKLIGGTMVESIDFLVLQDEELGTVMSCFAYGSAAGVCAANRGYYSEAAGVPSYERCQFSYCRDGGWFGANATDDPTPEIWEVDFTDLWGNDFVVGQDLGANTPESYSLNFGGSSWSYFDVAGDALFMQGAGDQYYLWVTVTGGSNSQSRPAAALGTEHMIDVNAFSTAVSMAAAATVTLSTMPGLVVARSGTAVGIEHGTGTDYSPNATLTPMVQEDGWTMDLNNDGGVPDKEGAYIQGPDNRYFIWFRVTDAPYPSVVPTGVVGDEVMIFIGKNDDAQAISDTFRGGLQARSTALGLGLIVTQSDINPEVVRIEEPVGDRSDPWGDDDFPGVVDVIEQGANGGGCPGCPTNAITGDYSCPPRFDEFIMAGTLRSNSFSGGDRCSADKTVSPAPRLSGRCYIQCLQCPRYRYKDGYD